MNTANRKTRTKKFSLLKELREELDKATELYQLACEKIDRYIHRPADDKELTAAVSEYCSHSVNIERIKAKIEQVENPSNENKGLDPYKIRNDYKSLRNNLI